MRPATSGLAPEGYPVIFLTALATLTFAMLHCVIAAVICLLACWFSFHFFRDPERVVPDDADVAVSPADGRVVSIEQRVDPLSGERRTCICIFMNVFNVHVNRMPVTGVVEKILYIPGKYFNASLDKASVHNERCNYMVRDTEGNSWTFVQIAGLIARRIVCRVEPGDSLGRGERFGMIRFGSRVDLYLPSGYIPKVSIGKTVLAGQTIVAGKN